MIIITFDVKDNGQRKSFRLDTSLPQQPEGVGDAELAKFLWDLEQGFNQLSHGGRLHISLQDRHDG